MKNLILGLIVVLFGCSESSKQAIVPTRTITIGIGCIDRCNVTYYENGVEKTATAVKDFNYFPTVEVGSRFRIKIEDAKVTPSPAVFTQKDVRIFLDNEVWFEYHEKIDIINIDEEVPNL